ncbi:MAG TPA: hypothetical protein DCY88_06460 [Cyanobacteria bacterium UBA11372]|nr:hypothetical protein [Cyanobacteria bacterium UBA11372]HBE35500.1 hypothetical protein [Cyanobacteria bacterium UBA11368]
MLLRSTTSRCVEILAIASTFENIECAQAIQDYLVSQGIPGKQLKLYTGNAIEWYFNKFRHNKSSII